MKKNAITLTLLISLPLFACVSLEGLRQYAEEKAGRLLECQSQDLSVDQAKACLGQYARDLGTKSCSEAEKWLDTLPAAE